MPSDATARDDARESCSLVSPGDRLLYRLLLITVLLLMVAPLWIAPYNTLVDYPSHLARAYVVKNYAQVPIFQQVFTMVLEPLPNTGCDLLLPLLLVWWTPIIAGKVFLSLIVLLFGWGCHLLAASIHGRPSWSAPLCALLAYHSNFLYGFVNYSLALGLFLVSLALWMRFRSDWTVSRGWLVACLAVAAYLAHLSAFVFLGMGASWLLVWDCLQRRRVMWREVLALLILAPSVLLYLYPWTNRVQLHHPEWPTASEKVFGVGALFTCYEYSVDGLFLLALASVMVLVWRRGHASWNQPVLWLAAILLLLYFAAPKHFSQGRIGSVDSRFVAPAFLLGLLAVTITLPKSCARGVFFVLLTCALARWGATAWQWYTLGHETAAMVRVLQRVRPQSRIYVLSPMPVGRREAKRSRAMLHTASYAVIERQSVPGNFFAARGVEPLIHRHPEQWVDEESPTRFDPQMLTQRLRHFDYLWGCNLDAGSREFVSARATLLGEATSCGLWDLHHPQVALRSDLPLLRIQAGNHLQRRRLTGQQW